MSTLNVGNITDGTNSVDTEKLSKGTAAAWANFNGTGTVAIRDSYNVSSITDNGTGLYTINLTNPLADTNYIVLGSATSTSTTGGTVNVVVSETSNGANRTTSSFQVRVQQGNGSNSDREIVSISVFGS